MIAVYDDAPGYFWRQGTRRTFLCLERADLFDVLAAVAPDLGDGEQEPVRPTHVLGGFSLGTWLEVGPWLVDEPEGS